MSQFQPINKTDRQTKALRQRLKTIASVSPVRKQAKFIRLMFQENLGISIRHIVPGLFVLNP